MNIRLFNKSYIVRRFGGQREVKGYITTGHSDFLVSMNVAPAGTDTIQALPEGERKIKRLEGHSDAELVAADQDTGQKGDLLFYHGKWYECVSAQEWDHTVLNHWNYQFTLVPLDSAKTIDLSDPPGFNLEDDDPFSTGALPGARPPATSDGKLGFVRIKAGCGLVIDEEGYLSLSRERG